MMSTIYNDLSLQKVQLAHKKVNLLRKLKMWFMIYKRDTDIFCVPLFVMKTSFISFSDDGQYDCKGS